MVWAEWAECSVVVDLVEQAVQRVQEFNQHHHLPILSLTSLHQTPVPPIPQQEQVQHPVELQLVALLEPEQPPPSLSTLRPCSALDRALVRADLVDSVVQALAQEQEQIRLAGLTLRCCLVEEREDLGTRPQRRRLEILDRRRRSTLRNWGS